MFQVVPPAFVIILATTLIGGCSPTPTGDTGASTASTPAESVSTPPSTPLGIDSPAPAWTNLIGVDDEQHSLNDLSDAKTVAVVFTCNHCPVAVAYEDRLVQLANDYADRPFKLVAINVNNLEEDKLPAMKERAAKKGFQFPYLYDSSQKIGRAYGATVTPHAFLLNADRKVVYMGGIDDNQDPDKVEQHYLRDAIDAVLDGKAPVTPTTQQFGCSIKYE